MSQNSVYLSVIVPVYNEAARLPVTLKRLGAYLATSPFSYEILVVLDGPTDQTRETLDGIVPDMRALKIVDRHVNRGKGYTVKEGMLKASGKVRLFTDADNSTDIAHFEQMIPLFDNGWDIVIASRNERDVANARQAVPQPLYKRAIGQSGNLLVQALAVRGIWDTQCGFKAFRGEAAERIFSRTTIEGWGFDIEALALAQALNYRIGIIPAHWINADRSHFRFLDYFTILRDTLRVRHNLSRGKYD
ncbi:MAG: dolichyl-phosphate beta-glucosyltransferase [Candidatus Binatia bacterium]